MTRPFQDQTREKGKGKMKEKGTLKGQDRMRGKGTLKGQDRMRGKGILRDRIQNRAPTGGLLQKISGITISHPEEIEHLRTAENSTTPTENTNQQPQPQRSVWILITGVPES